MFMLLHVSVHVTRDQCSIFSTGGKFCPDYGLLLELHVYALALVTRSYALLVCVQDTAAVIITILLHMCAAF